METQKTELEELLCEVEKRIFFEDKICRDWRLNEVRKAYDFAEKSHKGQFRADGTTSYITHPVAVAYRLATEFEQYGATKYGGVACPDSCRYTAFIQAGLLHDVVEDCGITLEEVAEKFGREVSFLVDGMTKVVVEKDGKLEADKDATLRKIAAYGHKDPRVFLIKLCDVAHNSSGIANLAKEKQDRFAKYGIEFYAPLAERLGFEELAEEIRQRNSKFYNGDGKSVLFKYLDRDTLGNVYSTFHSMEELS